MSNEIREILDNINNVIKLNENILIGEKPNEIYKQDTANESNNIQKNEIGSETINDKIKSIRKIAINLISILDPDDSEYKIAKSIWDTCDKYFSNKNEKETNNTTKIQ